MNILELIDVEKDYESFKALNKVSFSIKKGEIYGFVGENGAGKTTTMNIICGLSRASSGKVIFKGEELKFQDVRKEIGYLPQSPKFYDYMRVREYMDFIITSCGLVDKDHKYREEILQTVGLKNAGNKFIKGLSGGMKQRLGIGAAICGDPSLIILDEPTSALDPEGRRDVLNIIKTLKDKGMTIFFSTHLLKDAESICDYITVLHKGEVIKSSSMESLKKENTSVYYEIEYSGDLEVKELPSFINSINHENGKIIINVKSPLQYENHLYEFLLSLKVMIKNVKKKEFSLEDAFFQIIKGESKVGI